MESYKAYIEMLAKTKSSDMINNSSSAHASVLASTMFKYGKKGVNIFTGQLHPATYSTDDVLEQVVTFLIKGGSLRILIEEPEEKISSVDIQKHSFLNMLKSKDCNIERVFFRRVNKDVAAATHYHFMYMDDVAFRFEPNKKEPVAFASFNKPDVVKDLAAIFDSIWKTSSTEISI